MNKYFLLLCVLITGCSSGAMIPMPNPSTSNFPIWAIKYIDVSDGVELYEAKLIAKAYFVSGISTCGFPGDPVINDGVWKFSTYVSNIDQNKDITIEEKTGNLHWNGQSVSFEDLRKLPYVVH